MAMTVQERDQYESLKADWPTCDYSYHPDREHPFRPAKPRCRSDSMDLAAHPGAVAPARLRSRLVLRDWHLDDLMDDLGQVLSELASNAVQATREAGLDTGIRICLTFDGAGVLVSVWDAVPSPPAPAVPDEDRENGRGLFIVAALAEWQDCRPVPASHGGGKLVRAYVARSNHGK